MSKPNLQKRTGPGRLDWEELRTVLAVVRAGSLSAAARELNLEHSTIYRRIESIERYMGTRLFERTRVGYVANSQGEAVAERARAMEEAALSAERQVFGADTRLRGTIRLATSELFARHLLPPLISTFTRANPEIRLEIDVSNRPVDLTRREADLALRGCEKPPEHLIGQEVAPIRYAIYVSRRERARLRGRPHAELEWLGFDEPLTQIPQARWWRSAFPDARPRLWLNSLMAMHEAVAHGLGAAVLPCFAAVDDARVAQVSDFLEGPVAGIWLLRHPDVRGNARVRAFAAHISRELPMHTEALRPREKARGTQPAKSARRGYQSKSGDPRSE